MILQVLFKQGGRTIRETIANKFLHHDQSQIVYYSTDVRNMSGLVLSDRGIVEHDGMGLTRARSICQELNGVVDLDPDGKASPVDNRLTDERVDALISSGADIHAQSGGYDCSCEELDHLVDIAGSVEGVVGAGLTGGGLGGCVLVLVKDAGVAPLIDALQENFYDARGLESDMLVCTSVEGAGIV